MRAWQLGLVVVTLLAVAGALLVGSPRQGARGSVLASGPYGWLGAARMLEAHGGGVAVVDSVLTVAPADERPLLLVFPWQRPGAPGTSVALRQHLRAGGTLLLAYAGLESAGEAELWGSLGVAWQPLEPEGSLYPLRWWREQRRTRQLRRATAEGPAVDVPALDRLPLPPTDAELLLLDADSGQPAAFSFAPSGGGRVVVLPMESLANAWLSGRGNADFLASLAGWLGAHWRVDEYHHGVAAAAATGDRPGRGAVNLLLLHLAVAYLAAAATLARSFGPVWPTVAVVQGSHRDFLVGLGALHDRLGHHADAARRLLARLAELDPAQPLPPLSEPVDRQAFLALAQTAALDEPRKESADER